MYFETETSRTQKKDALQYAKEVFGDRLKGSSDALFTDSLRSRVIVFTDMKYRAPIVAHVINDRVIYDALSNCQENVLIDGGDLSVYAGDRLLETDEDVRKHLEDIRDTVLRSPGTLNENGELLIDLKSYRVGSHYGVNLLLGDRSEYADCLQSTPKSVLDEFGRGSFRGKQEKQVLATRYVLSPEENGEPANRQFYITENGRQIF